MSVTKKEVEHIANLARLKFDDKEIENFTGQMNQILGYMDKLNELLSIENIDELWQNKRKNLLKDKIDVTDFTMWFVENFPESLKIMREKPEYQDKFK